MCVFFFKQKTAYEMRISDWSSDVCSSDLVYTAMQYGTIDAAVTGFQGVNSQRLYEVSKYVLVPASFMGMTMMGWAVNKQWQIGSASCRERVCQYVLISVVDVSLKKKQTNI